MMKTQRFLSNILVWVLASCVAFLSISCSPEEPEQDLFPFPNPIPSPQPTPNPDVVKNQFVVGNQKYSIDRVELKMRTKDGISYTYVEFFNDLNKLSVTLTFSGKSLPVGDNIPLCGLLLENEGEDLAGFDAQDRVSASVNISHVGETYFIQMSSIMVESRDGSTSISLTYKGAISEISASAYSIIGKWKYIFDGENGYCILTFNANGSGTYYEYDINDSEVEWTENFAYTYNDDTDILHIIERGDEDDYTIRWVSPEVFITDIADHGSLWVRM